MGGSRVIKGEGRVMGEEGMGRGEGGGGSGDEGGGRTGRRSSITYLPEVQSPPLRPGGP